jgi:hypothetical protein
MAGDHQYGRFQHSRRGTALMVPLAFVRQFANSQQIDVDVADQEVVLRYALQLLNQTGLLGRQSNGRLESDNDAICSQVRARFAFLTDLRSEEQRLLDDQTSHREQRLFGELRSAARELANTITR